MEDVFAQLKRKVVLMLEVGGGVLGRASGAWLWLSRHKIYDAFLGLPLTRNFAATSQPLSLVHPSM
jgi:hypothetical protein